MVSKYIFNLQHAVTVSYFIIKYPEKKENNSLIMIKVEIIQLSENFLARIRNMEILALVATLCVLDYLM